MSKIQVTGLELKTQKGQKVTLTLAEAKELHTQLDELFRTKLEYVHRSYPYYQNPYYWYNAQSPVWDKGYITTYNTNGDAAVSSSTTGMQMTYLSAENSA